MRQRHRKHERSGNFLLLGKIESDAICETWRASRITSEPGSPHVVIRRFPAVSREALGQVATRAIAVLSLLRGPSLAREQTVEPADGTFLLAHEHEGGRSLALITDRARNGPSGRLPIPPDLAFAIAEKVAISLAATHELTYEGTPAVHGGLLPHFVWINGDGDVRVTGQELGRAMQAALANELTAPHVRPFLAPEVVDGEAPTPLSDIYSMGALLYLLLTGDVLPECLTADQNIRRIQEGRSCISGDPLDAAVQTILVRCLAPSPAMRYASVQEFRDSIAKLLHSGGTSTPTTFNLAFYLHTLLRKDLEKERKEQENEIGVDVVGSLRVTQGREGSKRKLILAASAFALVLASGIAAAYLKFAPGNGPSEHRTSSSRVAVQPANSASPSAADQIVPPSETSATTPLLDDSAAREAAFEAAVNARLQKEMVKLQATHDEQVRRQRQVPGVSKPGRTPSASAPSVPTPSDVSSEALERRRTEAARQETEINSSTAPPPTVAATPPSGILAREGQLVELAVVDTAPTIVRSVSPVYPPLSPTRKIEGPVIVSALVSETGRVLEALVLRGDNRSNELDEAAVAAVRGWQFSPAIKDGQRVRTWMPVAVSFKMPK